MSNASRHCFLFISKYFSESEHIAKIWFQFTSKIKLICLVQHKVYKRYKVGVCSIFTEEKIFDTKLKTPREQSVLSDLFLSEFQHFEARSWKRSNFVRDTHMHYTCRIKTARVSQRDTQPWRYLCNSQKFSNAIHANHKLLVDVQAMLALLSRHLKVGGCKI